MDEKWSDFVDGKNGFFYGIPAHAHRVVKFNPLDKSLAKIGPDFGNRRHKWQCGVQANNVSIYCAPFNAEHILKIDTNDGTVEKHSTISSCQRPVGACGHQGHLPKTISFTTCQTMPIRS